MSLKQFRFEVTNTRTGEKAAFIGDGETLKAAMADGVSNLQSPDAKMAVKTTQGGVAPRTIAEFESDYGYMMPAPPEGDEF